MFDGDSGGDESDGDCGGVKVTMQLRLLQSK